MNLYPKASVAACSGSLSLQQLFLEEFDLAKNRSLDFHEGENQVKDSDFSLDILLINLPFPSWRTSSENYIFSLAFPDISVLHILAYNLV